MKKKSIITIATMLFSSFIFAAADSGVPKDYPLKKCPISGDEYGHDGMKPLKVTYEGTDVWLCCKGCKKDFDKDPSKYTKAVKDASPKK